MFGGIKFCKLPQARTKNSFNYSRLKLIVRVAMAVWWEVSLNSTFLHAQNILDVLNICQQPRCWQQVPSNRHNELNMLVPTKPLTHKIRASTATLGSLMDILNVYYQKVNICDFWFWRRWINGSDLLPPKITKNWANTRNNVIKSLGIRQWRTVISERWEAGEMNPVMARA